MKGVACFGFDTRIYISNVLARLSPFLRFDSRLQNIKRDPFTSFSWRDRDRNRDRGNSANHVRSLSPPSFDRNGITLKKRKKKKKERIRYWNIRNRNDNCTVRTSMDEEHEVDFKVSLSKCF